MVHYCASYLKKVKAEEKKMKFLKKSSKKKRVDHKDEKNPSTQVTAKYAVHGFVLAFQYWGYEDISESGKKVASRNAIEIPIMLGWKNQEKGYTLA